MARKKKTVTVKDSQPIIYSGNVTVKKIKNGKIVSTQTMHNAGYNPLFQFLLNCLAGNYVDKSRPKWIYTCKKDGTGIKYVGNLPNYLNHEPAVLSVKTGSNENFYIEYKFLLSYSPDFQDGFSCLALYSENNKPAAFLAGEIISGDYSMLVTMNNDITSNGEDILIIWQLQIENPTVNN